MFSKYVLSLVHIVFEYISIKKLNQDREKKFNWKVKKNSNFEPAYNLTEQNLILCPKEL